MMRGASVRCAFALLLVRDASLLRKLDRGRDFDLHDIVRHESGLAAEHGMLLHYLR